MLEPNLSAWKNGLAIFLLTLTDSWLKFSIKEYIHTLFLINLTSFHMINKIRKRAKAWKAFYAQGLNGIDPKSPWHVILTALEYSDHPYPGHQKMVEAVRKLGVFSKEEQKFLNTLPAYPQIKLLMLYPPNPTNFSTRIFTANVSCTWYDQDKMFPIAEYTVITDRKELLGLEICQYIEVLHRYGIVRYDNAPRDEYPYLETQGLFSRLP